MKSESEMPPQVSSKSTTPLILSPTIRRDIGAQKLSTGQRLVTGIAPETVGDSRIVLNGHGTQNSLQLNLVQNSTQSVVELGSFESQENFSEHQKPLLFDTYRSQAQNQNSQSHIDEYHHNKAIQHAIPPLDVTGGRRGPSFSNIRAEQLNREHHLGFSTIESKDYSTIRQRSFDPHGQQLLSQRPQPPVQYTATAAEIAHPSYSQNHKIGESSRAHSMTPFTEIRRDVKRETISFQSKEADEDGSRTSHSTDSITAMSPGRMTPIHDPSGDRIIVGTPSTVSTAPSSDDDHISDYKLDETSTLPKLLHPIRQRRRSFGEDDIVQVNDSLGGQMLPRQSTQDQLREKNPWLQQATTHRRHSQQRSWDGVTPLIQQHHVSQHLQPQQRIASFRNDAGRVQPPNEKAVQAQNQRAMYSPPQPFPHSQLSPQQQNQLQGGSRKISYQHQSSPTTATPPRSSRNQRQQGGRQSSVLGQGNSPHQPSASSQRSSSEVLKTLLRKKACLYEPDTSRAVALVTWLVGRILALEYGFFSRQQLQSGVHACVSRKIEAGTITRTKVNRCMQIILNSCFHYIIPRSDGTEEKGDYFRDSFAKTVQDDSILLKELPQPWNDLIVDRDAVIHAILHDPDEKTSYHGMSQSSRSPTESPKHSPRVGGLVSEKTPEKYVFDGDREEASKRAVLLCFNENVRSAEDVFRCHNDFIRDTANASSLQLTAQEWSQFFGHEASQDPHQLGNVGVPARVGSNTQSDLLGQMSKDEVGKFRTSWCTKRYEHDHDLCGFAHVEINGGWLRRNPLIHSYKNEMCRFVTHVRKEMVLPGSSEGFFLNECPHGVSCDHAHSMEEVNYHPSNYKNRICNSVYSKSGGCGLGDVCPNAHPLDSNRPLKKQPDIRSPDKRGKKNFDTAKANAKPSLCTIASGSPVVYASPAPMSRFERQLAMPGLQNLYRRQCEVLRAFVRSSGKCECSYSLFGDTTAISMFETSLK